MKVRQSRNLHRSRATSGRWRASILPAIATLCLAVLFVGGITVGWSREARTPGPYLVVADPRSIEAKGVTAADWVGANLSPGNSIVTDRINGLLMAAYGRQNPQSVYRTAELLLFSDNLGETELRTISDMNIRYLVIDERLTTGLPLRGFYMTRDEAGAYHHEKPIEPRSLEKFDGVPGIDRIFDNGDIVIYDVSSLLNPTKESP